MDTHKNREDLCFARKVGSDNAQDFMVYIFTRRTLLKTTAVGLGIADLIGTGYEFAQPTSASASAFVSAVKHPGMLHTQADFDRMRAQVNAGAQPWIDGWNKLIANSHSSATYKPNPQATIIRGGSGQNYGILYNDIAAAYQNALRWKISGDTAHADTASTILNAWSGKLTQINGTSDRWLASGIYGYEFANAAEIMRDYPGFNLPQFKTMMLNVFWPMNQDFLVRHNGHCNTHYWANWDLCNMASSLAIGILCDDQTKIQWAIDYFKTGSGNGSILHAIPFLHPGGLAQWQESGRDQGHSMFGIGLMGDFCEMAWNQGQDLYGYSDNRFLQACEYVAKYNLGNTVPFTTYTYGYGAHCVTQTHTVISDGSRGQIRPVWERVYNHYVNRRGLAAPYTAAYAAKTRPEGGGGDYGPNSGGYDHLGFGTLTSTLAKTDVVASPTPTQVKTGVASPTPTQAKTGVAASPTPTQVKAKATASPTPTQTHTGEATDFPDILSIIKRLFWFWN